jgi:flagellar biosynthesis protein FlhG
MKDRSDRDQGKGKGSEGQTEIWAVGSGKGGTGKTFVVCQLAECLASRGKEVILIDMDFGGANVHTFFGIKNRDKSITKFFEEKVDLENLLTESQIKNLAIVPGNTNPLSLTSFKYAQKIKLFRHIKKLKADYILLDLGGGTGPDTIDAFLLADKMIAVAVPEITAIENLYQFIKSAYFRKLKSIFGHYGLKERAREFWKNRSTYGIKNLVDLLDRLKNEHNDIDTILSKELAEFSLNIILNKVRNVKELQEGFSIRSVCIKYIGVEARYSGFIEYDFQFWRNLSLIQTAPRFIVSHSTESEVEKIAGHIINGEQMKIGSLKYV